MTKRNIELLLLCVAAPIVVLLFAMLTLTQGNTLGIKTLAVPLGIFASFFVAHLAIRKFTPNADPALLPITFALSGIGIAFVTRLAPNLASRQVLWLFAGIVIMVLVLVVVRNLDNVSNYKYTLMILGVLLLLSPLLPVVGTETYGSRIWLTFGPFSVQPGEFAKICIVLFLASYLANNREMLSIFTWRIGPLKLPELRAILPVLIMWGMALFVVIFEKDLGSALVFFFVFITMLYVASGRKFYLVIALLLATVAAFFLWRFFSHVQVRVDTWLNPFKDSTGSGYQLVQATFSMADGDLFGCGIGKGLCDMIPVVESDFIFAAIAEEAGLLGAASVLLLFLAFAIRGFLVATRAKSDVSSLVATGLTTLITLQAFIIVGGVTRVIPLTGLTLPFLSQGGSSLLASFMIVGFLLRAGDVATQENTEMQTTGFINLNSTLGRVSLGKRLTGTLVAFSMLFVVLVGNLTYIMVINADTYKNMANNNHTIAHEQTQQRGSISTSDGVVLAKSEYNETTEQYDRTYPAGTLASHVLGYASVSYGTAGIEQTCNDILKGQRSYATWSDVINAAAGKTVSGNDVTLSINSKIQTAAQNALDGYTGACVVMDPKTGAVVALASSPTYSTSDVESLLESAAANTASTGGAQNGSGSSGSALYNRATQAQYAPGSTFKIVSLATALQNDIANEDTTYSAPGTMDIGNAPVTNFNKESFGYLTLSRATMYSSNVVYGQLGLQIGSELLVKSSEAFGFNQTFDFDIPLAKSLMPVASEMTDWETAWAAAGEPVGEHSSPAGPQSTVLQMAMVGCGIANDGTIMKPYLLESVHNASGVRSYAASPTTLYTPIDKNTAQRVRAVLEDVVKSGTGTAASLSEYNIQVAGKTGTAETGGADNSWFVGMAPSTDAKYVVAITVEGSKDATTLARQVFESSLRSAGVIQ